jgi:hypothetical protein
MSIPKRLNVSVCCIALVAVIKVVASPIISNMLPNTVFHLDPFDLKRTTKTLPTFSNQ